MSFIKRALWLVCMILFGINACSAEFASMDFQVTLPPYVNITPVTSPVLVANITDKTGNLYAPLSSRFKVITNFSETKTLYLQANVLTSSGNESAMYEEGGRVYIAFGNIARLPKASALAKCKIGGKPSDSPGIVSYPITSIQGLEHKFIKAKGKYEVYAPSGLSYVTVNVGTNVNKNSFAENDPRGFYQAILSLTEADL